MKTFHSQIFTVETERVKEKKGSEKPALSYSLLLGKGIKKMAGGKIKIKERRRKSCKETLRIIIL